MILLALSPRSEISEISTYLMSILLIGLPIPTDLTARRWTLDPTITTAHGNTLSGAHQSWLALIPASLYNFVYLSIYPQLFQRDSPRTSEPNGVAPF
jgi:hypothetical protein